MRRLSLDELRMLFGFLLLVIVAFICVAIALGKVEEQTSFGLTQIITVLSALGGGFANWAFSSRNTTEKKEEVTSEPKKEEKK